MAIVSVANFAVLVNAEVVGYVQFFSTVVKATMELKMSVQSHQENQRRA